MNDPAPFRLSLPQARALKLGVAVSTALAVLLFVAGFVYALETGDARHITNATLAGSVLLALLGLGLYIRRALGLAHQRQMTALAWLTDPHTTPDQEAEPAAELAAEPAADQGTEIPAPRPSADRRAVPGG